MDTLVVHVDLSFLDSSEKKWIVDTADEVSNSNKDADKERICQVLYLSLIHISEPTRRS